MELIRPLPSRKNANGHPESWGLFECPVCWNQIELRTKTGRTSKACPACKLKATNYKTTIEDAKASNRLRAIRKLGSYQGKTYYLAQCPECLEITIELAQRLQQRWICPTLRHRKDIKYKFEAPHHVFAKTDKFCAFCRDTIPAGVQYLGAQMGFRRAFACGKCEDRLRHQYAEASRIEPTLEYLREQEALRKHFNLPPIGEQLTETS